MTYKLKRYLPSNAAFWIGLLCSLSLAPVQAKEVTITSALATPVMQADKPQTAFLRVALTGFELDNKTKRPAVNVAIVLDKSGSMSGEKMTDAKNAAIMAIARLSKHDMVSVVSYDTTVNVIVPATRVKNKTAIYNAIETINANGSTALFAGVSKGAQQLRRFLEKNQVNRIILLSDGIANVGPSSPNELGQLGLTLAKEGISVTTIGLGLGYNEDLMTKLANYSDGNHAFVENSADLATIFDREFGDVLSVVAQEVDIEIQCEDGIKPIRLLGRDSDIIGNKVYTRLNQLYSQQEKYVILEVEVPAQKAGTQLKLANVKVAYNNLFNRKRYSNSDNVVAQFSRSAEEVTASLDKAVYETAIEQVATETSDQAIQLRDQGNVEAAQDLLEESAAYLSSGSKLLKSEKLQQQSREARQDAADLDDNENWGRKRKQLKEKVFKRSNQQSY